MPAQPKKTSAHLGSAPSLWKTLGPSFILLGLALGSGELLLWPYLAANYGLGLLWGALLGISFQYVLNTEVMRYTLARGESAFLGWRKLSVLLPVWFIISTFIPWSIPGFSSASAQILSQFFPQLGLTPVAILLLLLTGTILTLGKTLYKTMETLQRTNTMVGITLIALLAAWLISASEWQTALTGLVGRGDGWWFFPPGVSLAAFLGAFAYSGAGGNLNLAQTYYVKEKGFGMAKGTQKIASLLQGGTQSVKLEGRLFADTPLNRRRWREWWQHLATEHLLVFWLLGLITIVLLSTLAYALVYGQPNEQGIGFLYGEAQAVGERTFPFLGRFFLVLAGIMLFFTQLGVLESSSRIISENVLLLSYKPGKKFPLSLAFYTALWGQILLGIVILLLGFREPRLLLTLAAVLNAAAMMVAFPLIFWLNRRRLPRFIQPGGWRKGIILVAFLFFLVFVVITFWNNLP